MRSRLVTTILIACILSLLLPAAALAWSNGPSGAHGFGTHDWVLKEANRLAAKKGADWVRLGVALPHTDDPDTVFHDTYYHCYDVWGSHYGNSTASFWQPLDAVARSAVRSLAGRRRNLFQRPRWWSATRRP